MLLLLPPTGLSHWWRWCFLVHPTSATVRLIVLNRRGQTAGSFRSTKGHVTVSSASLPRTNTHKYTHIHTHKRTNTQIFHNPFSVDGTSRATQTSYTSPRGGPRPAVRRMATLTQTKRSCALVIADKQF